MLLGGQPAWAGGMFGPPQTLSQTAGGLNTAIGYRYVEDTLSGHTDFVSRQNQIYSQAAYGRGGLWEIYGRLGITDFKIFDAFRSASALTTASKMHFDENWKFFGTLGAKAFYPFTAVFGVGAFVQGSYNFSNFTDDVTGVTGATPFSAPIFRFSRDSASPSKGSTRTVSPADRPSLTPIKKDEP